MEAKGNVMQQLPETPSPVDKKTARKNEKWLYSGTAIVLILFMFLGFQSFYLHGKGFPDREIHPAIKPLVIAHGLTMTLWMILFVVQTLLISRSKVKLHMNLGKFGVLLAAIATLTGLFTAIKSAQITPAEVILWGLPPKAFFAVPFFSLIMFSGFIAVGVLNRKKPAIHRPMMLMGTLAAMGAALDRVPMLGIFYRENLLGSIWGPFFPPVAIGLIFLLLKWGMTRNFDKVFAGALAVVAFMGVFCMSIAGTGLWMSFASLLLG